MEAIQIFLVVMSCAPDLLSCENMSKEEPYHGIASCQMARERLLRDGQRTVTPHRVVFAKCQYLFAKDVPGGVPTHEDWRSADRLAW